jgi:cytochrome c oxidase subunit 2
MFAYALQSRPKRAAGLPMVIVMLLQAPQFPGAHSALDPAGPQAAAIKDWLWDPMLAAALVTFVLVTAALLGAAFRRRPTGESPDDVAYEPHLARAVGAATALTVVVLFAVLIMDGTVGHAASGAPPDALRIRVTGHQWWWDVQYPDSLPARRVTTANEIHVPVGRPVVLELRSTDVIHSFWTPSLSGKRDLIPGRITSLRLQADRPGVYRGLCAEFCGAEHAKMAFLVIAEPADAFEQWLAREREAAPLPSDALAQRGRDVFLGGSCPLCHAVAGTPAGGRVGPELSHLAGRRTVAAGTRPNLRGNLAGWILDPQSMKPGAKMPPSRLSAADLQALVAYLETLR